MKVIYARQPLPFVNRAGGLVSQSIFLVGPTPRERSIPSWRPEALKILEDLNFEGTVFVPEDEGWGHFSPDTHQEQIWWEIKALGVTSCVAVWLNRELPHMPAFTTNTEVGLLLAFKPERLVFGIPPTARKTNYQATLARDLVQLHEAFGRYYVNANNAPIADTMHGMLSIAVQMADV
ncbi:MAG: hypothetical protein EBQ80_03980 [Proteobacteria bacterium]|nr:hypothetical protein [Pseudomonadota bacterium]